jgi:hypothetical protein
MVISQDTLFLMGGKMAKKNTYVSEEHRICGIGDMKVDEV